MTFEPYYRSFEDWLDENPEVRIEFPEPGECSECLGTGDINCYWCKGTGCHDANLDDVDCQYCSGKGTESCPSCYGYDPDDKAKDMYEDQLLADSMRVKQYNEWLEKQ